MNLFGEKKQVSSAGFHDIRVNIWGEKYGPRPKPMGLILLIIIAVIALGGLYPVYQLQSETKDDVTAFQSEVEFLDQRIDQLQLPVSEERQLREIEDKTKAIEKAVETIAEGRDRNIPLIEEVMNIMPGKWWLASINLSAESINLTGDTTTLDNLFAFVRALGQQDDFVNAKLDSMGDTEEKARVVSISDFAGRTVDVTQEIEIKETEVATEEGTITIDPGVVVASEEPEGEGPHTGEEGKASTEIGAEVIISELTNEVLKGETKGGGEGSEVEIWAPPATLLFSGSITSYYPLQSYTWDFGDGVTNTVELDQPGPTELELSQLHTYTQEGDFTTTLTASDIYGTEGIAGSAGELPDRLNADFTAEMVDCENPQVIRFNNTSTTGVGERLKSVRWDFNTDDEESADPKFPDVDSTDQNPVYYYESVGEYTVKLTVETVRGRTVSTEKRIIAGVPPSADFNMIPLSSGNSLEVQFVDTSRPSSSDAQLAKWEWTFGDGRKSDERDPTHKYGGQGPYDVTLEVTETDGTCGTITRTIQAVNTNNTLFTAESTAKSLTVSFTALKGGPNAVYQWAFGDGTRATGRSVSHTYQSVGTYTVSLGILDMTDMPPGASEVTGTSVSAIADITVDHSSSTPFSVTVERTEEERSE